MFLQLKNSDAALASAQRKTNDIQLEYERKLLDADAKVSTLEGQLGKLALSLRQTETESAAIKSRLDATARDLDLSLRAQLTLQKSMESSSEERRRESDDHRNEASLAKRFSNVLTIVLRRVLDEENSAESVVAVCSVGRNSSGSIVDRRSTGRSSPKLFFCTCACARNVNWCCRN